MNKQDSSGRIPPGQQLVATGKWPVIGEKAPSSVEPPWTLTIEGEVQQNITLSLDDLRKMPQTEFQIDIHCVTRWSKLDCHFGGIFLQEILQLAQPTSDAKYISFASRSSNNHTSSLVLDHAIAQEAFIALTYEGAPLEIGHGGPIRSIVPGRYFYKSVKWLERIELRQEDRLGNWEADSGYHNHADPWKEERYISSSVDKRTALKLIQDRNFSNLDLRSIDATDRELDGLNASHALLRDSRFDRASLREANFESANLSNAHFVESKLTGANFRSADIEGADFSGADLRGADFTGASLIGSSFANFETGQFANIDKTTLLPEDVIAILFPQQLEFVKEALQRSGS